MISYEEFGELMDEIAADLPEELFEKLNGGIIISSEVKIHPESNNNDLVTLGQYNYNYSLGRYIEIFYGSFCRMYGNATLEKLKQEMTAVLKHEFLHHLESLAGEKDLAIKDAEFLAKYKGTL